MNFIKSTTRIVSRFGANNQQNSFVKGIIGSTRNSSFAYVNTIKVSIKKLFLNTLMFCLNNPLVLISG